MLVDPLVQADSPLPIPARAGIGLRGPHHAEFVENRPEIGWIEVHSENFLAAGGIAWETLERIRADYPVSLHGVGLSLGSADAVDRSHLARLACLSERIAPGFVSEHLSWGAVEGQHSNDLLPLPFTNEASNAVRRNIEIVQEQLGRRILIENVSAYLSYRHSEMSEWEFLVAAAQGSGAGILLDVNNIYVNACNHDFSATAYIDAIPAGLVEEIHLAGHSTQSFDGFEVLIDTHDAPISEDVWALFEYTLRKLGSKPSLIERDANLPPLGELLAEAGRADRMLERAHDRAA